MKKKLFDENEYEGNDSSKGDEMKLKINKDFAKRFEHRKEREHLEKAKQQYGEKILDKEESSSDDGSEDEFGDLVNKGVTSKFLKTLAKIRGKDKSIYNQIEPVFNEHDFEKSGVQEERKKKDKKAVTYKDMVRQAALKKINNDEEVNEDEENSDVEVKNSIETPVEEQARLKREFKFAASQKAKDEDEGFFKVKEKTLEEEENEEHQFQKFIKKEKKKSKPEEIDLLERMWGNEESMDETDKFLRKYILNKGWIDKEDFDESTKIDAVIDDEDEKRDEEMEEFEEKYNFRFEEPGSSQINTFSRNIEDSYRIKDGKRKEKRKEKEERKKEEKTKIDEEIKKLKNIKKKEIMERLEKIQQVAGKSDVSEKFADLLEKDYDDNDFTNVLENEFDDDYYEQEDDNEEELKSYEENLFKQDETTLKAKNEEKNQPDQPKKPTSAPNPGEEDKDNILNPKSSIPLAIKKNLKKEEISAFTESKTYLWWYCDHCKKGIQELEPRFDCEICKDFTLCKKCSEGNIHEHKLKKFFVPQNCKPPTDEEILEIIGVLKICKFCFEKLGDSNSYYQNKEINDVCLCEDCYNSEHYKSRKNFVYVEAKTVNLEKVAEKDVGDLRKYVKDEELNKLVDEYYALNFEDIIAGGLKTRFKYEQVEPLDYGLDDEDIFYNDDLALNKYVSLKKLSTYRSDNGRIKEGILKKKRPLVQKIASKNKKKIKKEMKQVEKVEEKLKSIRGNDFKAKKQKRKMEKKLKEIKKRETTLKNREEGKKARVDIEDLSHAHLQAEKKKKEISKSRLKSYGLMELEEGNS